MRSVRIVAAKALLLLFIALALLVSAPHVRAQTTLANALDTTNLVWVTGGTLGPGWLYEADSGGGNTFDGIDSAKTGLIANNGVTWLQTTVVGPGTISFWWKAFSEPLADWLEFYVGSSLQGRISGVTSDQGYSVPSNWEHCSFTVPDGTNTLQWRYVKDFESTGGTFDCAWVDRVAFSPPIVRTNTATAVTASGSPSVFGQAVTFTATVTSIPPGSVTPTGAVTFKDGETTLGSASLSAGQAVFTTALLPVASHSITATYSGDIFFKDSDSTASPLTQIVNLASTTTTVASPANPSVLGQSVSFTATVNAAAPGAGTPSGTVQFSVDGLPLGSPVSLSGGTATSDSISSLTVAGHTVTAVYSGESNFNGSDNTASPLNQTVNPANTKTAVIASVNPAVFGQAVTFTATVSTMAPGTGTPTGTVTFKDGAATLGTGTLSAGLATFTTSALSVSSHAIAAVYGGNDSFNPSTSSSLAQTVNKAATTTALASSANPSVLSQSVTFTAIVTANSPGSGTPTGTVTFKDGATALSTMTLASGQVTFATSALSIAAHSLTAVYNGDTSFNTSTSPGLTQTVNRASTAVTLSSSTNPIVFGQTAIFTATVAAVPPGSGTPTGTVTFKDGTTALGTNTLVSGQATYTNAALSAGTHLVTVVYNGDASFNTNTSLAATQTVNQAATTTTVSSTANPSAFGQPVAFTATVDVLAPGAGIRTGTVQFAIDGTPVGSPVALSGGSATSSTFSSLTVSGHSVTATYSGESNFSGSDNNSSPLSQTVNAAGSSTILTSSANPSAFGQSVTFTAAVSAIAPGAGTRTGTVQFSIDGSPLGSPVNLSGGSATSPAITTLSVTGHTVTAAYSGDANFNPSDTAASPLTQTVNKANTTTAVAASTNLSVAGQPVVFTATVGASAPGAGTPGGTITFKDGASILGTATLSNGQATLSSSSLPVASHSITAVYGGDDRFNTSTSSTLSHTVNKAGTTTTAASAQNPSMFGQSVVFTATVSATAPGSGTPSGTVTFKDGTTSLATITLSGGQATYTSAALSATAHSMTVVYNGDGNFNTSTSSSLTQTVNKADTTMAVTASDSSLVFGQAVTFTATVSSLSPGSGIPTGTVTFKDGATILGTGSLSAGQAAFTTTSLPAASHSITASYGGDASFGNSDTTASPLTPVVNRADTTMAVVSSANPSVFGQTVSFTATINAVTPGAGTPGGTVQFRTNGVDFGGAVSLLAGSASSSALSGLAVGTLNVTAIYSGDSSFNSSDNLGSPLTQTVNPAGTTTAVASLLNPSVVGDPVTFTATVSGSGTPTGTVQFTVDGADFGGPVTLSNGSATSLTTATLGQGNHAVTAVYSGDGSFNGSSSGTLAQTVNAVQVTAATGGGAIAADTTGGGFTTLTGPVYSENSSGNAGTGTMILNAPVGFVFDTGGTAPTVLVTRTTGSGSSANNINGVSSLTAVPMSSVTPTQLAFTVTSRSASGITCKLTWQNVRVRPTAGTPLANGNLWMGGTANAVGLSTNVNCGTLREVSGAAALLTIQTQPSASATAGVVFAQQPVIQVRDQFGNLRSADNGTSDNSTIVTSARSAGSGTLQGTTTQTAADGVATFGNLSHLVATDITIRFSSGSLTNATSTTITVHPATATTLAFAVQPANGTVGAVLATQPTIQSLDAFGNNSAVGLPVSLNLAMSLTAGAGLLVGTTTLDIGTGAGNGTASFSNLRVDTAGSDKRLTASAAGLTNTVSSVFTVNKAASSPAVASLVSPSVFGQSVTLTATVGATFGTPSGTVTFKDGATILGSSTLNSGQASFTTSALSTGNHGNITALYAGDDNYLASTSGPWTQTVNKADTSTAVACSGSPSAFGVPVMFTATVNVVAPGSGTPTGTVTFHDGGTSLGTSTLSAGQATFTTASLPVASHSITAVYNGDSNFNTSGPAGVVQVVNSAGTATIVFSSANPSVVGQSVTFTAAVNSTAPGEGIPSGTVQFKTNGVNFGSAVALLVGSASSPLLPSLSVGSVNVSAIYSGDTNFNGSDSSALPITQVVNKAATATAISSSKNPSSFGDPVIWTVTVSASAPGAGSPGGTVQFRIDGTDFNGPVTLSGSSATTIALSTLAPGPHVITAVYSGDSGFHNSTSTSLTQTVNTSIVTPATGGTAISADTTGGAYTSLTGPVYTETSLGSVGTGTIILNAPAGFVFDTGGTAPKVKISGDASSAKNINDAVSGTALAMTSVTATQLTFTVTASSGGGGTLNTLTWQDIRVRPVAGTPLAAGTITKTGTANLNGAANGANFGFLAEAAGAASRLAVQTQPSTIAMAGVAFAQQPAIQVHDQFGNARTYANRNVDNSTVVTVARGAGTAALQGALNATAINGLATFGNLSYDRAETITLQFTNGSAASATSGNVVVSPAAADRLVFTTQPGSAVYGSDLSPQPVVKTRDPFGNDSSIGLAATQPVTLTLDAGTGLLQGTTTLDIGTGAGNGTVTFSGLQVSAVGTGKRLAASSTALGGVVSSSFTINPAPLAIIHELVRQPDGNMALRASGTPGVTYLIQAGTNLTTWETIGTNTADLDGGITFLDQNATNHASRFYRTLSH